MRFKACPKCGGDLFVDQEPEGTVDCCLQCGMRRYPKVVPAAKEKGKRGGRHNVFAVSRDDAPRQRSRQPFLPSSTRPTVMVVMGYVNGRLTRRVVSLPRAPLPDTANRIV